MVPRSSCNTTCAPGRSPPILIGAERYGDAQVLVSKYADHLPLYRQAQIYARQGVNLDRSTLETVVSS